MSYISPATRDYGYKIGAAADWNVVVEDLQDHEARIQVLEALGGGVVDPTNIPIGGIILWSGAIGSIPAHFALCDGTSGTPNLTDRFVIGAGGSYAQNANGGALTHMHTNSNTGDGGGHAHPYNSNTGGPSASVTVLTGPDAVASSAHTHPFSGNTASGGSHAHSVGNTGSASNLPPYYALAYIMRVD